MIKIPDSLLSEICSKNRITEEDLTFLGGGREDSDGILYTFPEGNLKKVIKIIHIPKADSSGIEKVKERMEYAYYLGEAGISIACPILNVNDNLIEITEGEKEYFLSYIMMLEEGHNPKPEDMKPEFYQSWGRMIGKVHKTVKTYPIWKNLKSNNDYEYGYEGELFMFHQWCKDEFVKEQWMIMKKRLSELPINRNTYGFIQNDNHLFNVLWNGENTKLIDFDVATCQFFMHDISTMLQFVLFEQSGGMNQQVYNYEPIKRVLDAFLCGYEKENHLEDLCLKSIDTFVSYRRLLLFTVMQGFLNANPKRKEGFINCIKEEPKILI